MLLASWNVNSLKARFDRVAGFLAEHQPDALCLQETKAAATAFPHLELNALGYRAVDFSSGRWNGVAVLVRDDHADRAEVDDATPPAIGLPGSPVPDEARWVEVDVAGVRVVSTYVVNGRALDDPQYEIKLTFLDAIRTRVAQLHADGHRVAVLGDWNVAPRAEDVWDAAQVHGGTHVSQPERDAVAAIGLVDGFLAAPDRGPERFTWWDYRAGAFHKDHGMRIDLAMLSPELAHELLWVGIDRERRKGDKPSDHAPLLVRLAR